MLIALTGGIGAGKSAVSRQLSALGAAIIDADTIARSVVDPRDPSTRPVLRALRDLLGDVVFTPDGGLDRKAVASIIFGNADTLAAYNAIFRSALIASTSEAIRSLSESDPGTIIVHEIPLFNSSSAPLPWSYDLVVTVEAPVSERIRRLMDDRGYSVEEANARVLSQGSEESRVEIADVVLRNDGSREQMAATVNELWATWTQASSVPEVE